MALVQVVFASFSPVSMTAVDPKTLPVTTDLARQLRAHVDELASPKLRGRKPGTEGNRAAAAYLEARFREVGLHPLASLGGYRQPISDELGDNVIGVRPAQAGTSARWLLIGAHYDHLGGNYLGADDNASALAILIETARSLPPLPTHPVLFVAFNAEEPPYIRTEQMGSQHFVDHLPAEIGSPSDIQAVVIMDLMGGVHWAPLQNVLFAAGAEKSPALYRRLLETMGAADRETLDVRRETLGEMHKGVGPSSPSSRFTSPGSRLTVLPVGMHLVEEIPLMGQVAFSDYDAFRNRSVPFLFLSAGRTPRYHQPTDLPDTLHYERMAATVPWLRDLIERLDQDREPYRFDPTRIEFADEVATFRPLVEQAAEWGTRIPGTSPISLWKLKRDRDWLARLDPAAPRPEDVTRLERLSLRMQCLLTDLPVCFLL
ncbi:MAG: M28 family peptidase [Nitrospirota bacterium]